jgi:hypothetical protein
MVLPNFVGIGAQRTATTWMYYCLKEHPEVFVPESKELHFFNKNFNLGISWYEEKFQTSQYHKAIGEVTPNYINSKDAIQKMAATIPDAKLFAIVREPIQRAFSAYKLLYDKQYKGMSFQEVCKKYNNLIELGLYAKHFEYVFSYYDKSVVKVFLYDDIQQNPESVLYELFSFLKINTDFRPLALYKVYNSVIPPQTQKILNLVGLNTAVRIVRGTIIEEWIRRSGILKNRHSSLPKDNEFIQHLKAIFHDDIVRLQGMINRDLSHWL